MSWRDGVHLGGTPIWCDARRTRDICFVSAAHAIATPRHGQLIATAPTLALLGRASAGAQPASQLSVPYGRPFTLGTRRLELFRSGHAIGSASLLVQVDDSKVVYAGQVAPRGEGLGGEADLRSCDVLAIDARYGDERFAFPETAAVAAEVAAFCARVVTAGGAAVLRVTSPSKGLDVAARLAALDPTLPLVAHRSIHQPAQRLGDVEGLPRLRRAKKDASAASVLLWPLGVEPGPLPPASAVALVSGLAQDPGAVAAAGADEAFAWSNAADAASLQAYVDATGAGAVYLLGGGSDGFVEALAAGGRSVVRLAPPEQMRLF